MIAKVAFYTALETAAEASLWHEYQPKEPEKLRKKKCKGEM
ncbi:MAG: cyclic lactone autoinducer peptide [Lachnospiraceae bacterium]|nr:cyclic lactone autoinducer peptide [Lachnospiraceae bacterium]